MTVYDFSSGFNAINNAFANIGKQNEIAYKREAMAALGQDLASGNYASAAQRALASGDPSVGIAILGLGQKADERKAEAAWFAGNGGGGGMGQPMAALGQGVSGNGGASAPRPFNRPVQVAETEDDTQRLEADMARRAGLGYGNPTLPAGMRNNNPGNIKFVGTGQAPGVVGPSVNTDQGDPQAVFNSPEAGMSAAYGLAMRKYQGGKRTAMDLIAGQGGWTPGNAGAAANVARTMGVAPNEDLRLDDPQRAQAFMQALIAQEHGKSGGLYPREMIAEAVGGAQPVQGFSVPAGQAEQAAGLSADPQVQLWSQRLATAPTEKARAYAKQKLDLAVKDAETRMAATKPNDVQRNYQMAVRQGYGGTLLDYQKELRTQINNNVAAGEKEEDKKIGESAGKRAGETMAAAASASKQLMRLGQVEALMKNVETGRLQPGRMSIAALGKSLGVDDKYLEAIGLDPKGVGDAQALNAISGRMLVDMIGSGGFPANNFSNTDREFLTGTLPSLANDPRANSILVEVAKRAAKLDIEKAKRWREWSRSNPKGSFDDYELEFGDKIGATDMFADLAQKAQALGAAPAAKPAAAAPSQASDYLRANPNLAAEYDAKYGPGSAAKVLGQ